RLMRTSGLLVQASGLPVQMSRLLVQAGHLAHACRTAQEQQQILRNVDSGFRLATQTPPQRPNCEILRNPDSGFRLQAPARLYLAHACRTAQIVKEQTSDRKPKPCPELSLGTATI